MFPYRYLPLFMPPNGHVLRQLEPCYHKCLQQISLWNIVFVTWGSLTGACYFRFHDCAGICCGIRREFLLNSWLCALVNVNLMDSSILLKFLSMYSGVLSMHFMNLQVVLE
jgi:hypothetical protein